MTVTTEMVKELRERTSAGILECKKVLEETNGDMDEAVELLRERGIAKAEKKAHREASEGIITAYLHTGGQLGSLVEVNCETDFVARTDEFQDLAYDIAMQVTATSPQYVSVEDIPEDVLTREKEILTEQARQDGKPDHIIDQIVEGRLKKWYQDIVLLQQPYIKDQEITVDDHVKRHIAKLGENIVVNRFSRFAVGEGEEE